MIGETILHYKITDKLGEGGMGIVYKAEDSKLKREVAIKFLPNFISKSKEDKTRFENEAQAAASLNHPNIATIYAIEEVDNQIFIVMEYINGPELKEKTDKWLKEKGINSRLIVKVHFGPVICGYIGTKKDKKFDVFGETVNTTAILTSHGFSMTPQAFRCLDKEARTQYKKHTPPVRYIALEEHHKN